MKHNRCSLYYLISTRRCASTLIQIDPSDDVVTSSDDLRSLSLFIFKKQSELSAEKTKRDTVVDALFKKALKELHMELIGYEAVFDVCVHN